MNASISSRPRAAAMSNAVADRIGITTERLLAQDVLAGAQRPFGPLEVQRVGQRDVDGLDHRVGQQLFVAAVGALDAVSVGVLLGPARSRLATARTCTASANAAPARNFR